MNRRLAVAALGAGLAGPALPARAQGMPIVRGAIGGLVESFALPYYAKQRGFFLEQNLDVELTQVQGAQTILPAIVAGQVDFGVTNTGAMAAAHVRGVGILSDSVWRVVCESVAGGACRGVEELDHHVGARACWKDDWSQYGTRSVAGRDDEVDRAKPRRFCLDQVV